MKNATFTDKEILVEIRAGGSRQEKMIQHVYQAYFPFVYKALRQHRLSEEEAIDAFSDAVIAMRRHIVQGNFRGDSKLSTYLYRIFFNKCLNAIRKQGTDKASFEYELPLHLADRDASISRWLEVKDSLEQLQLYLDRISEKCKQVLLDALYWGFKMEEIAERHGYKDAATVRVKKHGCLKQLKALIQAGTSFSS